MIRIACLTCTLLPAWLLALASSSHGGLVDFEDVGAGLGASGYFNGGPTDSTVPWASGGAEFENRYTDFGGGFSGWEGWAYSNMFDLTTGGFGNQYSAYSISGSAGAGGAGGSATYALAFPGSIKGTNGSLVSFGASTLVHSVDLTNTTYTLLAFRDGNVGGFGSVVQYQDGDYLRLTITGYDAIGGAGSATGSVDIDLANYGGAGSGDDVYLTDWTTFDLSSLGAVQSLRFSIDSNVVDTFAGIEYLNTPAYVAVDNLAFTAVPEPSQFGLLTLALAVVLRRRKQVACEIIQPHGLRRRGAIG